MSARRAYAAAMSRAVLCGTMYASLALAQDVDSTSADIPRVGPPIRQITTAAAVSSTPIGSIVSVRELPDGRVLVNDGASRRLLLLDTMLVLDRVVLDSLSQRENLYGTEEGALIAHRGDSSLFLDRVSLSMLIIDPSADIARVRSLPSPRTMFRYARSVHGVTDARGRLVYQMRARAAPPPQPLPRGVHWVPTEPDSAFIVALDMDTRALDTVGVVKVPRIEYIIRARPGGGTSWSSSMNPMPLQDAWAVLPDGSIAVVRAIDYRVEYLNADGTWTSSGKIPHDWRPVPDEEKRRIVDSVETAMMRQARLSYTTSVIRYVNTYNKDYPPNFSAPEGYRPPNGFLKEWRFPPGVTFSERYIYGCPPGVEATIEQSAGDDDEPEERSEVRPGPPPGGRPSCIPQPVPNLARIPDPPRMRDVSVVSVRAIPDFRPPFGEDAALADMDGNLWIETKSTRPNRGGPVYDIVSREGMLVDRLQVPRGYSLVGFGRGRVVFLSMRDAQGIHLARVRLR